MYKCFSPLLGSFHTKPCVITGNEKPNPRSSEEKESNIVDPMPLHSGVSLANNNAHFVERPRPCDRLSSMVLGCGPGGLEIDLSNAVASTQVGIAKGEVQEIHLHTGTVVW